MEKNNLIVCTIGIMISVILIGGLLMPVVNNAIDDQYEYYNNSVGQFSKVVSDDVTIEYIVNTTDNTFTYSVDGVPQTTISDYTEYNDVLIATSGAMLKVTKTSTGVYSYIIWYSEDDGSMRIDNPNKIVANITKDDITVTVTKSDNTVDSFTIPIDWGFYGVTEGNYRAVWEPYDVYINDVSQVYSVNWLNTTNQFFSMHGETVNYMGSTITADYDLTAVSGAIDVSTLKTGDLTFTVDNDGTPYTATPFNVIVPVEIIGEKTASSDAISGMLSTLPIIVIVSLLAAGVYFIIGRKN